MSSIIAILAFKINGSREGLDFYIPIVVFRDISTRLGGSASHSTNPSFGDSFVA
jgi:hypothetical protein